MLEIERASFGKHAWDSELFLAYWRAAPDFFLIAKLGRRIAGYSIARIDWRGADLESIAVDPAFRQRGVAQALLGETLAKLRTQQVATFRLMVEVENEPALRFYRQAGFIRVLRAKNYYGPGRDAWRMHLRLR